MLQSLQIKNLALVDALDVEFTSGLNVITGETGAGKSMIVGALNLLLGERADKTLLREGAAQCVVEAVFLMARPEELRALLQTSGIECGAEDRLIVKRAFTASGTGRQFVNDEKPGPPRGIELENCYPNPFNYETVIPYKVGERSDVALSIIDVNGRTVRTLDLGEKMPGTYSVRWNGETDAGGQAASGIYLINMIIKDQPYSGKVKKTILIR